VSGRGDGVRFYALPPESGPAEIHPTRSLVAASRSSPQADIPSFGKGSSLCENESACQNYRTIFYAADK
jgi:hypothetical protein